MGQQEIPIGINDKKHPIVFAAPGVYRAAPVTIEELELEFVFEPESEAEPPAIVVPVTSQYVQNLPPLSFGQMDSLPLADEGWEKFVVPSYPGVARDDLRKKTACLIDVRISFTLEESNRPREEKISLFNDKKFLPNRDNPDLKPGASLSMDLYEDYLFELRSRLV